jgi:activator of HSP90 ATPase
MDTGKSKYGLKSRKDMVQLKVMPKLHPILEANGKYTLPAASYNLTLEERRGICTLTKGVKVSTRFSVNPKKLVSMKDLLFTQRS